MSDRYVIKGRLGKGGVGVVYEGYDSQLDRSVAIKRLLPLEETQLNEEASGTLEREAAALAKFQHPNVVTIFGIEQDEEGHYVIMELIKGDNLKVIIEGGALNQADFIELASQALDAMVEAGEMNLLHRDIKPANVMLLFRKSGRFQIKILDFGLAKFSQTPSTQTLDQKGSFLGSIDYIAPEQIECLPLDARTDLYSLGCLFYFSLTQRPPFQGDSPATTMRNHLNGVVRDLKDIRPDIPKAVSSWIMRLISRRPEDRPATAAEAFRDFNFALEGVPRAASSSPIFPPSTAPTPSASPPIVAPPSTPIIVSEPARATAQTIQSGSPISQAPNTGIPQTVVPSTDNIPLARKATGSVPQSQEPSSSLKPQLIIGFVVILLAVILGVLFGTGIIGS